MTVASSRSAISTACSRAVIGGEVFAQHGELVAAEARDGVAGPDDRLELARHLDEQLVTGIVAEAVVDVLEPVEVEERDADRSPATARQRAIAWPRRSRNSRRFGSPVSGSCIDWCASRSSNALRSIAIDASCASSTKI